ncbi:hypothetical protein [Aliiglaciecola litoralis]|uniref:Uncharacterized protein n=1 Tax=Aliiglaciecola litoralis TaxID=582857 RepID=A0ABP3WU74_9ALTE
MEIFSVKKAISTSLLYLASGVALADVPFVFQSNSPAKATEVNQNFASLDARAADHESRIIVLEQGQNSNSADLTPITINGVENLREATYEQYAAALAKKPMSPKVAMSVDCSTDKNALRETFLQYSFVKHLTLSITGECYGSLNQLADSVIQIHSQVLGLNGEADNAALIADPVTEQVDLLGGFGGGLYLSNLDITLGNSDFAVLFSRNSHNSIRDTVINVPNSSSAWGIWAQAGAQFYIGNVTINSPQGIGLTGGAVMRTIGEVTIESDAMKYALVSRASTARLASTIYINGQRAENYDLWDAVVNITEGSNFYTDVHRTASLDLQMYGAVDLSKDSILSLTSLDIANGFIGLNHGKLQVDDLNHLAGGLYVYDLSDFRVSNGVMGQNAEYIAAVGNSSWVDIKNVAATNVHMQINGNVTFATSNAQWKSLYSNMGSTVYIENSTFLDSVELQNQSVANISGSDNIATTMRALWIDSGSAVTAENITVNEGVALTKNSTLTFSNSTANDINAASSQVTVNDATVNNLVAESSTVIVDNSPMTEVNASRGSNITLNNVTSDGKVVAEFNSSLALNSSTVENAMVRFNSSLQIADSTVIGSNSVVDYVSASIYIDRNSSLGFWGVSGLGDGALPIRVEASSFAEFDSGFDQGLDGITIGHCSSSVVYVPESANAIVTNGC